MAEQLDTARRYDELANSLDEQGSYKEAESFARKSFEIRQKVFGEEDPETAHTYKVITSILDERDRELEQAEECIRRECPNIVSSSIYEQRTRPRKPLH